MVEVNGQKEWSRGNQKKISVIALDPRAGKSYGEDIASLFGDVADISVFSVLDGSAAGVLEPADLFVASTDAYGSPEELAKHIPLDSQTMAIEVSFRWRELRKLKELPTGSKVLFVNITQTMAREAIAQLEQFGVTHVHWIPFYPGARLDEDVRIAVTRTRSVTSRRGWKPSSTWVSGPAPPA